MTDKNTVRLQTVEVDRGKDTLVTQVPEHEVEVLRAVHGSANVRVIDEHADDIELESSADSEFARLQNAYKRVNAPDLVRIAYPGGANDLRPHGFDRGAAREAPMSQNVDHKKTAKNEAAKKTAK